MNNIFKNTIAGGYSKLLTNINTIIWKNDVAYLDLFKNRRINLNKNDHIESWKINLINELLEFKECYNQTCFSIDEINILMHNVCTD